MSPGKEARSGDADSETEELIFGSLTGDSEEYKTTVESLSKVNGCSKGAIRELIQGGIDAHVESDDSETKVCQCVDTGSGMTPVEFQIEFIPSDASGGNE